ncbi:MAG: hypothetical protein E6045_02840 [Finegoldia magna]|jgi:hypothetical protein|nr:hypothetical protein [Finegoldia magna]
MHININRGDLERADQAERLLLEYKNFRYCLANDGYDDLEDEMIFELYKLVKEKEFHDSMVEEITLLYNLIYDK